MINIGDRHTIQKQEQGIWLCWEYHMMTTKRTIQVFVCILTVIQLSGCMTTAKMNKIMTS